MGSVILGLISGAFSLGAKLLAYLAKRTAANNTVEMKAADEARKVQAERDRITADVEKGDADAMARDIAP